MNMRKLAFGPNLALVFAVAAVERRQAEEHKARDRARQEQKIFAQTGRISSTMHHFFELGAPYGSRDELEQAMYEAGRTE